jgi:hypothetical protein
LEEADPEATRCGGREALCGGRNLARKTDRFLIACSGTSSLPFTRDCDCRDHRSRVGPQDPAPPGENRPIATGARSEFRVITNLFPCLLRGMSMFHGGVEGRVEYGRLPNLGEHGAHGPDAHEVGRVVQRASRLFSSMIRSNSGVTSSACRMVSAATSRSWNLIEVLPLLMTSIRMFLSLYSTGRGFRKRSLRSAGRAPVRRGPRRAPRAPARGACRFPGQRCRCNAAPHAFPTNSSWKCLCF